jgi:hypothetical protein
MHQDAIFMGVRLRCRFLAIGFVLLLALSFGCGVGATAFADEVADLDLSMSDSAVLVGEETVECAALAAKIDSLAESEDIFNRDRFAEFSLLAKSTVSPSGQVDLLRLNGGIIGTPHPTGPPTERV